MFRIILLFCSFVLFASCKPAKISFNKFWNEGTVEGATSCVEYTSTALLTDAAIKQFCLNQFEEKLPPWGLYAIDGRAGPKEQFGARTFAGVLTDLPETYLVTGFQVEVNFRGETFDNNRTYTADVRGLFEPLGEPIEFETRVIDDAPDDWAELPNCEADSSRNCWSWDISEAWGLRF